MANPNILPPEAAADDFLYSWVGVIRTKQTQFSIALGAAGSVQIGPRRGRFVIHQNGGVYHQFGTFSAAAVLGGHQKRYLNLGGPAGFLGYPTTDTHKDGHLQITRFENGCLVGDGDSVFWIIGAILKTWNEIRSRGTEYGGPLTDEIVAPDGVGRVSHFENGSIYYSNDTGAWEISGPMHDRWKQMGGVLSYLGYPNAQSVMDPDASGETAYFQRGFMYIRNGRITAFPKSAIWTTDFIFADGAKANAQLVINSDGGWALKGRFRAEGISGVSCALSLAPAFQLPGGGVLVFTAEDRVGGTFSADAREAHFSKAGRDTRIVKNWDQISRSDLKVVFRTNVGLGDVVEVILTLLPVVVGTVLAILVLSGHQKACKPRGFRTTTPDGGHQDEVQIQIVDVNDVCPED